MRGARGSDGGMRGGQSAEVAELQAAHAADMARMRDAHAAERAKQDRMFEDKCGVLLAKDADVLARSLDEVQAAAEQAAQRLKDAASERAASDARAAEALQLQIAADAATKAAAHARALVAQRTELEAAAAQAMAALGAQHQAEMAALL